MNKVSDLILTACQLRSQSKQTYKVYLSISVYLSVYLYIYMVFIDMYPTCIFYKTVCPSKNV